MAAEGGPRLVEPTSVLVKYRSGVGGSEMCRPWADVTASTLHDAAPWRTYPDDRLAVADLLERWNLGLGSSVTERRIALRLSREATLLDTVEPQDEVATPPSVARVLALAAPPTDDETEPVEEKAPEAGDDDADDELDIDAIDEDDFYADALEDA